MEFVAVFMLQRRFVNLAHQADDKIAGADKRIDEMHAFI